MESVLASQQDGMEGQRNNTRYGGVSVVHGGVVGQRAMAEVMLRCWNGTPLCGKIILSCILSTDKVGQLKNSRQCQDSVGVCCFSYRPREGFFAHETISHGSFARPYSIAGLLGWCGG